MRIYERMGGEEKGRNNGLLLSLLLLSLLLLSLLHLVTLIMHDTI